MKKYSWRVNIENYRSLIGGEAVERLIDLLRKSTQRNELGAKARETVRQRFLLTRKVEQYLDLFNAFEPCFTMNHKHLSAPDLPSPVDSHGNK